MMYRRPLRRTILQSAERGLRDVLTFMVLLVLALVSECDSTFAQVVRTHFNLDFVPWQDPDIVHPHFARDMCHDHVSIFQLNTEHRIAQRLFDNAVLLNGPGLAHSFVLLFYCYYLHSYIDPPDRLRYQFSFLLQHIMDVTEG